MFVGTADRQASAQVVVKNTCPYKLNSLILNYLPIFIHFSLEAFYAPKTELGLCLYICSCYYTYYNPHWFSWRQEWCLVNPAQLFLSWKCFRFTRTWNQVRSQESCKKWPNYEESQKHIKEFDYDPNIYSV